MAARFRVALIASAALGLAALLAAATAQPYGPGSGMMGRGMIGSWMMGGRGSVCNPGGGAFFASRADRLGELIKPTDAQRARFDEFKAASIKSAEIMREACQADVPETIIGRTDAMERHAEAMLQAVRTVRPALEALYSTLSEEQKTRIDANAVRSRFWDRRNR